MPEKQEKKITTKEKNSKSIEETLWDSANKLRGSVEPSEYKHVVLGLIFLKFASDKFLERRQELIAEGKQKYLEMVEFYTMKNVFYLPELSRWSYLIENAKQNDIALKIDTALATVEKNNPSLKGALPENYYSRMNLEVSKLAALLDTINNVETLRDKEHDIVGEFHTNEDVIWGGTGWEVLASGKPLLQSFRFKDGAFESTFGYPAPPMLPVVGPNCIFKHLIDMADHPEKGVAIGKEAAKWFNQYNGIGLAKKWLELILNP